MQISEPEPQADTRKVLNTTARKPASRNWAKLTRTALFVPIMTLASVVPATADSGALFFNLKFSTAGNSTSPAFGINFKQHEIVEEPWWSSREQSSRNFQGINLFSTNPSTPGLMNQIAPDWRTLTSNDASDNDDGSVAEAAMRILATVGLLGLTAAQISSDLDDGCSGTEILLSIVGNSDAEWCHED